MPITQSKNQQNLVCPKCQSMFTVKKGKRRNRLQILQLYQCTGCDHKFTSQAGKHKTYPLKTILEAISTYNLGHTATETQSLLRRKTLIDIPERTINLWLSTYKELATYARLRSAAKKLFSPSAIIRSFTLYHQQVYRFQLHQAKLSLLLDAPEHNQLSVIKSYLGNVGAHFPHHLFQDSQHRSSKFPAELDPPVVRKENQATRLAGLALPTSPTNKKRHETLQHFMLVNDSVTVAVEIPIYLTGEDIVYFRSRGFNLNFETELITGHIDFLQIRNGFLHILDYKPDARKEKHAHIQLSIYALALSRRVQLPLKYFKCAWFDEHDYFEFFPLQGVYQPGGESQSTQTPKSKIAA